MSTSLEAAKRIAGADWREAFSRHNAAADPAEFLVQFVAAGLDALGDAAQDPALSQDSRTGAAYALGDAVKKAAELLERSFPTASGHESAPDCGFIRGVVAAVEAMHRAATLRPTAFRWKEHYQAWPVVIAADRSIFDRCRLPEELPGGPLFCASGIRDRRYANVRGRSVRRGGIWAALAEEYLHKGTVGLARPVKITARGRKPWAKWKPWQIVRAEMEAAKTEIMGRPEIQRWAGRGTNARVKPAVQWSRMVREVQRALESIARQ